MDVVTKQPNHPQRPVRQTPQPHSNQSPSPLRLGKVYSKPGVLIATLIALILAGLVAWYFLIPHGQRIDTNGYQVVYLSSGQTYFGKLQNTNGDYLVVKTPYTAQDIQKNANEKKATVSAAQTTLVKLRDQVYGPEDSISLRADHVLFWQNLRDDSKVVSAIKTKQ